MLNLTPWTGTPRALDAASARLHVSVARLASLRRIQSAADDAAGLAISERLAAQMGGTRIARQGALDGVSLAQTADGALGQVSSSLQRMRELALQSRNGTLNDHDRASLDTEYQALAQEVGRVVGSTRFNGQAILAGDAGARQINTGAGHDDTLTLTTPDLRADPALATATAGQVRNAAGSQAALDALDDALTSIGQHRARLGATERRLDAAVDTADVRFESASRAYARITEAEVPATHATWQQAQVQQYAAMAMWRQQQGTMARLLSLFG